MFLASNHRADDTFDSRILAARLDRSIKEVSNDLGRLHRMGFLRCKRVKRLCLSSRGKLSYKGRQYSYSLSKQGLSYSKWLKEGKPLEDLNQSGVLAEVVTCLPQDLRQQIMISGILSLSRKYRGPVRNSKLPTDVLVALSGMAAENKRVAQEAHSLGLRNEELEVKNQELERRIASLKAQNTEMIERHDTQLKNIREGYRKQLAEVLQSHTSTFRQLDMCAEGWMQLCRTYERRYHVADEMLGRLYLCLGMLLPEEKRPQLDGWFGMLERDCVSSSRLDTHSQKRRRCGEVSSRYSP